AAALRSAGLPPPPAPAGRLLAALAAAGVFRLRAVLVGSRAFATYPALLGVALPEALGRTTDVDIAQDPAVSAMLDDRIGQPIEAILRERADPGFAAVPDVPGEWRAPALGLRLFTCNRGGRAPRRHLPALRADGPALRMMDFLLRDPVPAVVPHDAGVLVEVPDPARYAVHGLMIATRRADPDGARKALAQAAALIAVLAGDRPRALAAAHAEAWARGPAWRTALKDGGAGLPEPARTALALLTR
ncbi:MAG TPA: GSU2403 family nucleotidyltransferase fold protein, partial [Roseomonas sp.]